MSRELTVSIDAMGGDGGPSVIVAAIARAVQRHPLVKFLLHGDEEAIGAMLAKRRTKFAHRVSVRHAPGQVRMDDKPSLALRRGRNSSMWRAIESVKNGEAEVVVSAGNTGALMAMSMFQLGVIDGISRPAIAALWPTMRAPMRGSRLRRQCRMRCRSAGRFRGDGRGVCARRAGLGTTLDRIAQCRFGRGEGP